MKTIRNEGWRLFLVSAAQPNVNGSKLAKLKLSIPPLAEQQKIVANLDALSKKLRTLRDRETAQLADLIPYLINLSAPSP